LLKNYQGAIRSTASCRFKRWALEGIHRGGFLRIVPSTCAWREAKQWDGAKQWDAGPVWV
jgi:hypothetical protein